MPKKYRAVRMPVEAYDNFMQKKVKMEKEVTKIVRRVTKIPLTKVFVAVSENPININDEYMLKLVKRRKKNGA